MLYEFDIMSTSLPNVKDPNMTPEYISESPYLSFEVPSCPKNKWLKGLSISFKYTTTSDENWVWFAKICTTNGVDLMYNPKVFGKPAFGEVGVWLSYWPIGNTLNVGDKVNVSIVVMTGLEVCESGASLVYIDDVAAFRTLENNKGWVEILGGDLSGFQLSTGAYYLCRRDFFELMEVDRLTPAWFRILVGDTIDYTEVRGWRKTGRPQQSNQSFTELKTVKCFIHGPESEEIYKFAEMSKSSFVDNIMKFTSSPLKGKMKSGSTSRRTLTRAAGDMGMRLDVGKYMDIDMVNLNNNNRDWCPPMMANDRPEAFFINEPLEFKSRLLIENMDGLSSNLQRLEEVVGSINETSGSTSGPPEEGMNDTSSNLQRWEDVVGLFKSLKSIVNQITESASPIEENIESATSEFSRLTTKDEKESYNVETTGMAKTFVSDEILESTSSLPMVTLESGVTGEASGNRFSKFSRWITKDLNESYNAETMGMGMAKTFVSHEIPESTSSLPMVTLESVITDEASENRFSKQE